MRARTHKKTPGKTRRSTIYLEEDIFRALRLKAAAVEVSMSDLVNEAVRAVLSEDAEDLAIIEERRNEETIPFDEFVAELKKSGKI
ncbi:MAG: CopG family transcriptional regulator [Bacteroidetes bacterium]|nr:CopG family transcriptional regulator [Bacteroidota bacterium]